MSYLVVVRNKLDLLGKALFDPAAEKAQVLFSIIWLFGLYLFGIILWGEFFNWHRSSFSYFDWATVSLPRLEVIRDALHFGQFPFHLADTSSLHNVTDRFFGIPDVITTPQMLLMLFVDADTFAILDVMFFYTIATAGLIYFKRKFDLSLVTYSILFFLFNFNGYIQAHYSAGHASWGGYFLFPWFFILIFNFIDGAQGWRWATTVAFLLFYMLLAGSEHHFLWLSIFLVILAWEYRTRIKWILIAIIASGFLGAIRLFPPLLEVGKFITDPGLRFFSGYQTSVDVLTSLLFLSKPINDSLDNAKDLILNPLFPWETDIFVGLFAGLFIIYFGIFKWLQDQNHTKRFAQLILPALILFLLAHGDIYRFTLFRIPFLASERVSARMIAVPFVLIMLLATIYFQEWMNKTKHPIVKLFAIIGLPILVSDLWSHIKIWRVNVVAQFFHHYPFAANGNSIANHEDPAYITILTAGLVFTILSAAFLLFQSWREKRPGKVEDNSLLLQ
jgi:hypothetical protein